MPAFTVALAAANTNYNLKDLVVAIDSAFKDIASHLMIQSDKDNGASVVRLGRDANLSDTRYGYSLSPTDTVTFPGPGGSYALNGLYARSSGVGSKLNIDITR